MAALELVNLHKAFATHTAVKDFSLKVEGGEFISLLGPSGCGKTTTIRMVAGFEAPTQGQILLHGQDITHLAANKRKMGMVFQSYALFPNLTIAQNIAFGLQVAKQSKLEVRARVREMLSLIRLEELGERYPMQLSGGQQQRVALARALAVQPQVLLLDEPLSALDAKIRITLREEIRQLQRKLGITTIYVTHDQEEALAMSDRIVVMNKGMIEQVGTPTDIYNQPSTRYVAQFIGSLNLLQAQVVQAEQGLATFAGHSIRAASAFVGRKPGESVMLGLRPESILLGQHDSGLNQIQGNVVEVDFLGSVFRIKATFAGQALAFMVFNRPGSSMPKIGEIIQMAFQPMHTLVLADGPSE